MKINPAGELVFYRAEELYTVGLYSELNPIVQYFESIPDFYTSGVRLLNFPQTLYFIWLSSPPVRTTSSSLIIETFKQGCMYLGNRSGTSREEKIFVRPSRMLKILKQVLALVKYPSLFDETILADPIPAQVQRKIAELGAHDE